jgi:glutamine amidotransferase
MCELFCLSSLHPTRATVSLERFAQRGGYATHAIDGWGLALYDGHDVRLYKEPEPAADSQWLRFIEERRQPSQLLVSHVRHATEGSVCLANTQPFVRELGGRAHVFAHNGQLNAIAQKVPANGMRFAPLGETDSEVAFCILLERLSGLWEGVKVPSLEARWAEVARFASDMRTLGPANFLYSDSDALFAHGHRRIQSGGKIAPPGLWLLQRSCSIDNDAIVTKDMLQQGEPGPQELTLIASVPLSDEDWRPFDEGEIVIVRHGKVVII